MLSHIQTRNMRLRNVPPVLTRLADFNWYIYHAKTRGGASPQTPLTGEMQQPEQLIDPNYIEKQTHFLTVGVWPCGSFT